MEKQVNQLYKEKWEEGLKLMMDQLNSLEHKIPKLKEESDEIEKQKANLRKDIEGQKKAILERDQMLKS